MDEQDDLISKLEKKHIAGPQGVRGRNSDNRLIEEKLKWKPKYSLEDGLKQTYDWIKQQNRLNYEYLEDTSCR